MVPAAVIHHSLVAGMREMRCSPPLRKSYRTAPGRSHLSCPFDQSLWSIAAPEVMQGRVVVKPKKRDKRREYLEAVGQLNQAFAHWVTQQVGPTGRLFCMPRNS
jgi:hypothetical protein